LNINNIYSVAKFILADEVDMLPSDVEKRSGRVSHQFPVNGWSTLKQSFNDRH
jgi:DNA polymerase III delta prime subunit